MITFLFWNLAKNLDTLPHLKCLGQLLKIDVFILAECPEDLTPAILDLNTLGLGIYREEVAVKAKVRALTRLGSKDFIHQFTSLNGELSIWILKATHLTPAEVLVAGVHLPSKAGGNQDTDQALAAREMIGDLYEEEDRKQHRHTVLVGDFNMHPYDPGMTSVTGIHGLMTKKLAQLPDRVYRGQPWRRFYNPMWNLLGDMTPGPAGSYYWQSSVLHNTHWGILDQVLVRPELINSLKNLCVLEDDGNHTLVGPKGVPDKAYLSDHLPVWFQLEV